MRHALLWGSILFLSLCSCGDDKSTKTPPPDTTPPAVVEDLRIEESSGSSATFAWTAPGDDGDLGQADQYDIRYSAGVLSEGNWEEAIAIDVPFQPSPAGEEERFTAYGFREGEWHIALKTADEVPNWSPISNAVFLTVTNEAPERVTDLEVISTGWSEVVLQWTAPEDDGVSGAAAAYDLRHSQDVITEETWSAAAQVTGLPAPSPPGTTETFTVTGLDPATEHFLALKSADDAEQWSHLSNVVVTTTASRYRLTDLASGRNEEWPAWSPDGSSIAFSANLEIFGNRSIYRVAAEGGAAVRLTDHSMPDMRPSWSPDGRRLAFVSSRPDDDRMRLWTMDAETGGDLKLVADHESGFVEDCAWSPSGDYIAYTLRVSMFPYIVEIWIAPAEGGVPVKLAGHPPNCKNPTWSPDGTQIAFASDGSGTYDIWSIPSTGGPFHPLYQNAEFDVFSPSWSPDGSRIAFTMRKPQQTPADTYVVQVAGGGLVRLTDGDFYEGGATWSPDGRRIAYFALNDRMGEIKGEIWVLLLPDR